MSSPLLLIGAGGAVGLLALAARRPALAGALLALAIPLSAGMERGAVVPVLRVNEALLLAVAAGFLLHLVLGRRPLTYSRLDLAILGFCTLNVIIPWAVILLSHADAALDDWLVVLAPVQYAVVYVVYSRTEFGEADLRLFLNACMLASLPIAAIAAAEALDLGGVRDLVATYYPTAAQPSWDPVYRPASLLGHYSAVGAFGLLNLVLALALAASGKRGYPRWWLGLVMAANLLSLVASDTYAPLAVLPVGLVAALLVVRRIPWWTVTAALPVLAAAAVALWPSVSLRIGTQFTGTGGGGLPESMQTRIDYWQAFFIPALLHSGPWLGTGTLIPDEVPRALVNFVDNGYLWQLFRAGVPGIAALFVMLGAVAAVAWSSRYGEDLHRRVLGAVCLGAVLSVAALDLTSEYLTFTAVSQEFWMLVGLLSGSVLALRSETAAEALTRRGRVQTSVARNLAAAPAVTVPLMADEGTYANGSRSASLRIVAGPDDPVAASATRTLVVAEELDGTPDEGYVSFVKALVARLSAREPTALHSTRCQSGATSPPQRQLRRARQLIATARLPEVRAARPMIVVYASRSSLTLSALLRARLLRRLCGGRLALVALQSSSGRPAAGVLLRWLAPDLLLLPTESECGAALAQGVLAATISSGVAPERYGWEAIADRLVDLLDDLAPGRGGSDAPRVGLLQVAAARLRKAVVDRRGMARRLLFGGRSGYRVRIPSTPPIAAAAEPALRPPRAAARAGDVGVIDMDDAANPSPVATAAAFLGLPLRSAVREDAGKLIVRATGERWPLIGALAGAATELPAPLMAYLRLGGTVYLDGLDERSNEAIARLGRSLGVALPEVRRAPGARSLLLASEQVEFARELAGASLETECGDYAMAPAAVGDVLAWAVAGADRHAAVVQRRVGRGRIVLSVLRRPAGGWPADDLRFDRAGSLVVALLLLRERYGTAAWHAPVVLANATIDDPALRNGLLGMRYDLLAAQAREHGFHVTIATVPRELALADDAVVQQLRSRPDLLSACYHGCDHDGYEFYLTAGERKRHPVRSLDEQRAALIRAVEHGRSFASQRGCELDRVMVFPYGIGPASLFRELWGLGFLATCNFRDRYPLEAPIPGDPDLGLRPADLAWDGFPLLWRRQLDDDGYLMDLLLGRPLLLFAHRRPLGRDFDPLVERANRINRTCHGSATWRGLDEIARHAYLQRRVPGSDWQVLMTANEACLHNPDPEPRTYSVMRPYLPEGVRFEVDGRALDRGETLRVTVPAQSTATVRLVAGGAAPALRSRRACTIFEPPTRVDHPAATSEVTR
ncbi:MAG TPA: O-antigen ligase family protein [Terriglobales bacterium]|nr:O-antigen ligase family protein [Terriglobales bacterium]